MAVRWDKNLKAEARRTIKNYNSKLRYQVRKGVDVGKMHKASMRGLRTLSTRQEVLSTLRDLQKFSIRGMENVAFVGKRDRTFTLWEMATMRSRQRRAIKKAEREIAEMDKRSISFKGKVSEFDSMSKTAYYQDIKSSLNKLKTMKVSKKMQDAQAERLIRSMESIERGNVYSSTASDEFARKLRRACEIAGKSSEAEAILSKIKKVPGENFEMMLAGEQMMQNILNLYDSLFMAGADHQREREDAKQQIGSAVDSILGNIDAIVDYWSK